MISEADRSKQYIKSHLEPYEGKDFGWDFGVIRPFVALEQSLNCIKYEETGKVTLKVGDIEINYSYEPISSQNVLPFVMKTLDVPYNPLLWRHLTSFTLKNTANGALVDFYNLLPSDYHIVFKTVDKPVSFNAHASIQKQLIWADGSLTSPSSVISILHEIGHIVDDSRLMDGRVGKTYEKMTASLPVSDEMLAKILRRERNAWAFVLRILKPFLKTTDEQALFSKKRILDLIHNRFLGKYSDIIRRNITLSQEK